MSKVDPVPQGFTAITPHLTVDGAAKAIEWYGKVFGATCGMTMPSPDGQKLWYGEIDILGAKIMLNDAMPEMGLKDPKALGGSAVTIHLYIEGVDGVVAKAEAEGATVTMPPQDMFWGDRYAKFTDPFGHSWSVATHIADPTPEEMQAAMAAMGGDC